MQQVGAVELTVSWVTDLLAFQAAQFVVPSLMAGKSSSPDSSTSSPSTAETAMPLGQVSTYVDQYQPALLFPLQRLDARETLDAYPMATHANLEDGEAVLPFVGEDVWTAYELSWLDQQGRPKAAILEVRVPCGSPCMVESKSMKLCLNSLAQTAFASRELVQQTLEGDLSQAFGAQVQVALFDVDGPGLAALPGYCIDNEDVEINQYSRNPELLRCNPDRIQAQQPLYTHQFRSLCPVTGQPDFASIWLEYAGPAIDPGSLLAYLVSYRTHSGFHESAVEQIFLDLQHHCGCTALTLYGRFLRRGGIDINPYRSTEQAQAPAWRLARQ